MKSNGLFGSWLIWQDLFHIQPGSIRMKKNRLKGWRGVDILDGFETTSAGAPPAARVCL